MSIRFDSKRYYIVQKINLFTPNPKGSNLIFFTPFRDGVNEENQDHTLGIKADNHIKILPNQSNVTGEYCKKHYFYELKKIFYE